MEIYQRESNCRHIVVCGHITYESVSNFVKNFIHEDADNTDINVIFVDKWVLIPNSTCSSLTFWEFFSVESTAITFFFCIWSLFTQKILFSRNKPDLELEAFLKRNLNNVVFLQGSIMDLQALRDCKVRIIFVCSYWLSSAKNCKEICRQIPSSLNNNSNLTVSVRMAMLLQLRDARACLILANRMCSDPDEEDAGNIMRATSVKNYYPGIRVIIQLHQFHNKVNTLIFVASPFINGVIS